MKLLFKNAFKIFFQWPLNLSVIYLEEIKVNLAFVLFQDPKNFNANTALTNKLDIFIDWD